MAKDAAVWRPRVWSEPAAQEIIRTVVQGSGLDQRDQLRRDAFQRIDESGLGEGQALQLRVVCSILCDLIGQGWTLSTSREGIRATPADRTTLNAAERKARVRRDLLLERDAQLKEEPIRRFVREMERRRLVGGEWRSVFDLMRDGGDLANKLREARAGRRSLESVIDPYVQPVTPGEDCPFTGLPLQDIWRYFRHTWVTPYRSVPGRQISFLVRDRAAPMHPVIGIAALASSVIQQRVRDEWIGWHPNTFLALMEEDGFRGWPGWVRRHLREQLDAIYIDDFVSEGVFSLADLANPTSELISRLGHGAQEARAAHRLYRQAHQHKKAGRAGAATDWPEQARTHLFRSKRLLTLSRLLDAQRTLKRAGFTRHSPERLKDAVSKPEGRRAIKVLLRFVKASRAGVNMMDISVCGAVAPYNHVLGGKLVSLLMASPDVLQAYRKRYGGSPSIIASSMAGHSIVRRPDLVLLMTTSLYGSSSSQYNRLRMPVENNGAEDVLEYADLAHTAGFGSYQFSKATIEAMEVLLARSAHGREVNSIFGEGVSPKLRKVRGALDRVRLPSDALLQHGSKRIVYAVPLARNFRRVLLGLERRPDWILPQSTGTQLIVSYWVSRWLSMRIENNRVLRQMAAHSTTYPLKHGARVPLPEDAESDLGPLFSE